MSKIEWTEETWNPIIGCSKISEGCKNCYAEKMAGRLRNIKSTENIYGPVINIENNWNGKTHFVESALEKPLKRKKPTMYFVCSMGDLFHESVPFDLVDKVIEVIAKCPQHTFQILTKRAERMYRYFMFRCMGEDVLQNLWLGVTIENQKQANERILHLLKTDAVVRFVSVEPMLGAVDLTGIKGNAGSYYQVLEPVNAGDSNRPALDWVICGGESGPNARPMHPDWVRSLRDQCESANVPFFFKQWGEWVDEFNDVLNDYNCNELNKLPHNEAFVKRINDDYEGIYMMKVGKKKAGSLLDGKEYKQYPKAYHHV